MIVLYEGMPKGVSIDRLRHGSQFSTVTSPVTLPTLDPMFQGWWRTHWRADVYSNRFNQHEERSYLQVGRSYALSDDDLTHVLTQVDPLDLKRELMRALGRGGLLFTEQQGRKDIVTYFTWASRQTARVPVAACQDLYDTGYIVESDIQSSGRFTSFVVSDAYSQVVRFEAEEAALISKI